jgi:hypothetical protein
MSRKLALIVAAALVPATTVLADDPTGPKPGATVSGFKAFAATGDDAGKAVDFVAARKGKPTVYVFLQAEQWSRPMARFLKVLDQEIVKGIEGADEAATVAVWLTDDKEKSKEYLPVAQQSVQFERTTLAVFEGDTNGPADWSIDPGKYLSTIVVRDGKVIKGFGYVSINETDVPEVVKALKKS